MGYVMMGDWETAYISVRTTKEKVKREREREREREEKREPLTDFPPS